MLIAKSNFNCPAKEGNTFSRVEQKKITIIVLEALINTVKIITFLYEAVDSKLREACCSRKTMLTLPLSK